MFWKFQFKTNFPELEFLKNVEKWKFFHIGEKMWSENNFAQIKAYFILDFLTTFFLWYEKIFIFQYFSKILTLANLSWTEFFKTPPTCHFWSYLGGSVASFQWGQIQDEIGLKLSEMVFWPRFFSDMKKFLFFNIFEKFQLWKIGLELKFSKHPLLATFEAI